MVSRYHMLQQPFFGGAATVHKFDEDESVLEDSMLDHSGVDSGLEMSPAMAGSRRESFAVGGPIYSPRTDAWAVDMHAAAVTPSSNPFGHSNNPFMRMDQAQAAVYGTPNWSMDGSPMQQFEGMPYDGNAPTLFAHGMANNSAQTLFAASQIPLFPGLAVTSSPPSAMAKDWMAAAVTQNNDGMAQKSLMVGSPAIRSHNELRRGDGIRKKNARFDIPVERTLNNIDNLIAVCKNDADLKELKQQKRLLRNRQAA